MADDLTMKAVLLRDVDDLELVDLPVTEPGVSDVVVQLKACGLCATDVNMWLGTNTEGSFPFIPGHEWSGEIVEVGRDVDEFSIGDRVVGEVAIACNACANCNDGMPAETCTNARFYGFAPETPGCMAEYHTTPASRLLKIPDNVSNEAAALLEPVWVGYASIWVFGGGVRPDDSVVILGCGPIGLLAMLSAKAVGATVIAADPQPYRRQQAISLGADVAIDPSTGGLEDEVMQHTGGRGASLVLECSGSDSARSAAVDIVANKGRIVLVGINAKQNVTLDLNKVIEKGIAIVGSQGDSFYFARTLTFLSRQLVDFTQVISHRFSLDQVTDAFKLGARRGESMKIMLIP